MTLFIMVFAFLIVVAVIQSAIGNSANTNRRRNDSAHASGWMYTGDHSNTASTGGDSGCSTSGSSGDGGSCGGGE